MYQLDLFSPHQPKRGGNAQISRKASHAVSSPSLEILNDRPLQPDVVEQPDAVDLPEILQRLADVSARPRYTFMVLNLIARVSDASGRAGPYVREGKGLVGIRDWLSDALIPVAQRDPRRLKIVRKVRAEVAHNVDNPTDPDCTETIVAQAVRDRLRHSGRTNVSRAVSDLVRAGLLRRHYQGYRIDHENRGAQREAVYTIMPEVRRALGQHA
ncbi:hypothetical protein [Novosphingobium sp. 9U]|uniref:hypothetical protein n=1 Tax=Novosphingobium sp. 9U TaxID=2653158 RepID=UPI0012F33263|nr:hypothetical protein [Novosphingobium sp. 9U]VWX49799.1 conserved hypothetical protein [Novosphingobium sp. 9U]